MKLLSLARDLKRRKARERHGLFVAEGVRTVEALLDSPLVVRGALVQRDADHEPRIARLLQQLKIQQTPIETVDERTFADAADTESPQGILAIAQIPQISAEGWADIRSVLVLDAVQDPGNVGTIIRSAHALGAGVTVSLPGTVDLWNAKVVRSAMGSLFTHQVVAWTWEQTAEWLAREQVSLWVAAANGVPLAQAARERPARLAIVVANEGNGVSSHVAEAAHTRVAIPMVPGAESLNVAVATGILLYVLNDHTSRP